MGRVTLSRVVFSDQVKSEWGDPKMWEKLLSGKRFANPVPR